MLSFPRQQTHVTGFLSLVDRAILKFHTSQYGFHSQKCLHYVIRLLSARTSSSQLEYIYISLRHWAVGEVGSAGSSDGSAAGSIGSSGDAHSEEETYFFRIALVDNFSFREYRTTKTS